MTFLEIWSFIKVEVLPAIVLLITVCSPLLIAYFNAKGRKQSDRLIDLKDTGVETNKTLNETNKQLSNIVTKKDLEEVKNTVATIKDIIVLGYNNSTLPEEVKQQVNTKDLENKLGGGAEIVQGLVKEVDILKEELASKAVEAIKETSDKAVDVVKKSTRIRG